ncbi:MAG: type IV toxin-antitoxin system AbiEi family antitoxin domain-containing protein [Bacilli bacterium]|nr:type IV toxin-antitoxin system AbiEi family antitoxin domain-containing protein [Bacilli bacterium]
MKKKNDELLLDLADENDGYVSAATARENGIAQTYLSNMCEQGIFIKAGKGLYRKRGYESDPFFELSFRYGKAVFSLDSCLFLHGLKDEQIISVYLPTNYLTRGIEGITCRHVGKKEYLTGQSLVVTPKGNLVMAYDLERTMIDLLRQRERFDKETFLLLWNAAKKKSPYPAKLARYAQTFHVEGELSLLEYLD